MPEAFFSAEIISVQSVRYRSIDINEFGLSLRYVSLSAYSLILKAILSKSGNPKAK